MSEVRMSEAQMNSLIDAFGVIAPKFKTDSISSVTKELQKVIPSGAKIESIKARPVVVTISLDEKVYWLDLDRKQRPRLMFQPI